MELPDLLDLLRSKGVSHYECRDDGTPLVITLGPLPDAAMPRLAQLAQQQRAAPAEEFNAADIVLGRVGVPVATEGEG